LQIGSDIIWRAAFQKVFCLAALPLMLA
jgi:hypothetical protein